MWYGVICLVRTPDQCDGINRLFSARGRSLFNDCHYIEIASQLSIPSSAKDNYMTTHFVQQ